MLGQLRYTFPTSHRLSSQINKIIHGSEGPKKSKKVGPGVLQTNTRKTRGKHEKQVISLIKKIIKIWNPQKDVKMEEESAYSK